MTLQQDPILHRISRYHFQRIDGANGPLDRSYDCLGMDVRFLDYCPDICNPREPFARLRNQKGGRGPLCHRNRRGGHLVPK